MSVVLSAKNISKIYEVGMEKISALKNVSIEIQKGEFVSIVGKSGSGKSTLMHILGLLDTPTFGEVVLNGTNTKGMKERDLAHVRNKEIGFVFQAYNLLQRTNVLDNVMLPLTYSEVPEVEWRQKARKMIDLLGLTDRINNKSNELSGGQKQRVAIARALVNEPSILLADEPTGNLDTKTGDEIIEILKKLHQEGKTVVLVTHNPELADLADRKIVIKDGEIVSV